MIRRALWIGAAITGTMRAMSFRSLFVVIGVGLVASVAGCKKKSEPAATPPAKQDAAAAPPPADAAEVAPVDAAVAPDAAEAAGSGSAAEGAGSASANLWKDPEDEDLVNPLEWQGVTLSITTTDKPAGKAGGKVIATAGGTTTDVTEWEVNTDVPHWADIAVKGDKAALHFGWQMNLKTKDQGADNFVELVVDKKTKKVVAKRTWSGTRLDSPPAWAKIFVKTI